MTAHKMGLSRLNHGNAQCEYCHATDLEINLALGPVCPNAPMTQPGENGMGEEGAEIDRLRAALIDVGRQIPGCVLADTVSTDFLMLLPEEMRQWQAKVPATAPLMTAITQHPDLTELRGLIDRAEANRDAGTIYSQARLDAAVAVAARKHLPALLDHIDRLTEEAKASGRAMFVLQTGMAELVGKNARLTEDNVRLRRALRAIATPGHGAALDWSDAECSAYWARKCSSNREIARQALTPAASEGATVPAPSVKE